MALTAKGEATRKRIVEGAAAHLRSVEFTEITLDDVMAVSQTSRSQLFHYFPEGKDQLLLAVMQLEADRVLADQEPYLSLLDSWDAWEQWRSALIARYSAQGSACPLHTLVSQIGTTPGADQVTRALLARWQLRLSTGIRSMQTSGHIRASIDADRVAGALISAIEGGVVVMWSTKSTTHLEAAVDIVLESMRGQPSTLSDARS
ncbi:TetR/AcrR family transcriptional regulator [Leifsonia sp. NPDC058292]|uniref:TetR/AcrR family transcriptional regulator n=1 Tax=Leifsonia sp. NPDC058292 TaxID=3346428 RepID=UPI0036D96A7E